MRESIARGHDVFMFRTFWIRDAMHLNTVGPGQSDQANLRHVPRHAHDGHGRRQRLDGHRHHESAVGARRAAQSLEQRKPQLPLFRITCKAEVPPHPFLGRVIYTQDPGRALISGKCNDVGAIVMQQFRGLSARAPYFSNGSAGDAARDGRFL